MFRNIFTKTLRDYRWAVLGWGIGLGVMIYAQYATFASTFSGASSAQIQQLVQQFRFFGEAVRVSTPGGFVTFKIMGVLPAILGIWTVLAGARMIRGEEERGTLDLLLSVPQSRTSVAVQKLLALAAATGSISVLMALGILGGMSSAGVSVDPAGAFLTAFNAGLTAYLFGVLALLVSQFTGRGAAAGWAGGLMALFYVLDGTGRSVSGASWLRPVSPFYYYNRNLPLVPGYTAHWVAPIVLVALCVLLAGAAMFLFRRRDIGRTALADLSLRERRAAPSGRLLARADRSPWTRDVLLQALRRQGTSMLWWILSLAVFSGYLVVVARSSEQQFQQLLGNSPFIKQIFSGTNLGTNAGFLSALVFGYVQLLLPIFAGITAVRWASDLDTGRLELLLATPLSRPRVILARYAAVLLATIITTLCIWLSVVLFAGAIGFTIDGGRVAEASAGMLPLALLIASLVFALAGLLPPGLILGIMAIFLAVSYLAETLKSLLSLPGWIVNLSIFHQYGHPLLHGLNWTSFAVMLLIAALVLTFGTWQFSMRDVDRGSAA